MKIDKQDTTIELIEGSFKQAEDQGKQQNVYQKTYVQSSVNTFASFYHFLCQIGQCISRVLTVCTVRSGY